MRIDIISVFPQAFTSIKDYGVCGRAIKNGIIAVNIWNPRDYCQDNYRSVDDRPYGGGPGMVMRYEPLQAAIQAAKNAAGKPARVICLSPQGQRLDHKGVTQLASLPGLILLAGRYEGVDQRLLDAEVDEQWSIGDYVLSGGELAAMVMVDALTRLLPGTLGHAASAQLDSFADGLLDWPHYTRPEEIDGFKVPQVLLGGDHKAVEVWRKKQALGSTWLKRPDLLRQRQLSKEEEALLQCFKAEYKQDLESS